MKGATVVILFLTVMFMLPDPPGQPPVGPNKKEEMPLSEMLKQLGLPENQEEIPVEDEGYIKLITADRIPFKVELYLRIASKLQQLGKEKACKTLLRLAVNDYQGKVSCLCRMLFRPKKKCDECLDPHLGAMSFLDDTLEGDWPVAPLEMQNGVPFFVVFGFNVGGTICNSVKDVKCCIQNRDWSDTRFDLITKEDQQKALADLLASKKWKKQLSKRARDFLSAQIQ
jgi:hypothetical protein